jgi:hypothetical protein
MRTERVWLVVARVASSVMSIGLSICQRKRHGKPQVPSTAAADFCIPRVGDEAAEPGAPGAALG